MSAGEVVVDSDHPVVLTGVAFVSGDQLAGSISIVRSVRRRQQIEKRLNQWIDRDGGASAANSVAAAGRITRGWQQSLMGEGVGYRGNCRGRLYFAKPLIVYKEERMIALERPANAGAELVPNELRDRTFAQIEIVLSIEQRIPMQLPQGSVNLVTARLGDHPDNCATVSAILGIEGLRQNANLGQFIQAEKKSGGARGRIAEDGIGCIHPVNQNVRHARTCAVDCYLSGLAARKQRRSTAGVRSDSRLQRNRTKKIAVIKGEFRQALRWNETLDSRRRALNGGGACVDGGFLRKVTDRQLRVDPDFHRRGEINSF